MRILLSIWRYLTQPLPDPDEARKRQEIARRALRNRDRELEARRLSEMAKGDVVERIRNTEWGT